MNLVKLNCLRVTIRNHGSFESSLVSIDTKYWSCLHFYPSLLSLILFIKFSFTKYLISFTIHLATEGMAYLLKSWILNKFNKFNKQRLSFRLTGLFHKLLILYLTHHVGVHCSVHIILGSFTHLFHVVLVISNYVVLLN